MIMYIEDLKVITTEYHTRANKYASISLQIDLTIYLSSVLVLGSRTFGWHLHCEVLPMRVLGNFMK